MLAHTLKNILELVPEALPMVKQASVDKEFPLDNKDSCIATALQLKYFEKIAFHSVEFTEIEKIAKAVHIYGVGDVVKDLASKMVKAAQDKYIKDHELPGETTTPFEGVLNKEAALKSLTVRFNETKDQDFVKVASAIYEGRNDPRLKDPENLIKIAEFVDSLDRKNGLTLKGFNFRREAFFEKQAAFNSALNITVRGKKIPFEKFAQLGKDRIAQYLGKDIARELDNGPENFKATIEALPMDLQMVASNLVKNV